MTKPPPRQCARASDSAGAGIGLRGAPREVYDLLVVSERALTAYELLWRLENKRGQPVQPPTVYRALKHLLDRGVIHKVRSLGAYVACSTPEGAHEPVFFICGICGGVTELDAADVDRTLRAALVSRRFTASRISLDVHGVCAACRRK